MDFAAHIPINSLSFGQVSVAILREFYKMGVNPTLFHIQQPDLSAQTPDENFNLWLKQCEQKSQRHNRKNPVFRLWHPTTDSLATFGERQILLTFHETNTLTDFEINILSQQHKVLVTSRYTKQVFEMFGLTNVVYCPLGFDSHNFRIVDVNAPKTINWGIFSKMETRKCTLRVLQTWAKLYGNNPDHTLICLIRNPFLDPTQQNQMIVQALGGQHYWNISFKDHLKTNFEVNQLLNATDINLSGVSHCEGFNLTPFHSLCLGKQAIFLNSHVHKDFCTSENSILIEPKGMIPANDGLWFKPGGISQQGFWEDFSNDDLVFAMKKAEKKAKILNYEGIKLQQVFSFEKTASTILSELN